MSAPVNPFYPPAGSTGDIQKRSSTGQFGAASASDLAAAIANANVTLGQITGTKITCTASSSSEIAHFTNSQSWSGTQYSLIADGYSNMGGFRINGADGQRAFYLNSGELGFGANSGDISFSNDSAGVTRMVTIKADTGMVGIGTNDPGARLDIAKTNSGRTIRVYDQEASTGTTRVQFRAGAGDGSTDKILSLVLNDGTTEKVSLTRDGNLTVADINTGDGACKVAAGTYTPTLSNVANVSASTAYSCQYMRVGSVVTVSGKVDVTATSTTTDTKLGITLPIASNLANENECAGTASAMLVAGQVAAIHGDATNDRAEMRWASVDTSSRAMFFTFTYRII